jgi:two-component system OmpR family sensor kinase/two-component system sensor histidine kinase QseC
MRSLRLRLFTLLLALAALAALAVGGGTYVSVRAEADELFDYHLRQMALSLRDQGRIPDAERAAFSNPELDYVVQIWSVDGVALYSSQPPATAVPLPPHTVIGFSNVQVGGATWRVFGAAMPQHIVQVGQPLAVRRRLATAAAWRSVLPIVAAAPLVILAMWWLVGFTLAPLQRVVAAARARRTLARSAARHRAPRRDPAAGDGIRLLLARLATAFDAQRAFVADAAHEVAHASDGAAAAARAAARRHDGAPRDAALVRLRARRRSRGARWINC